MTQGHQDQGMATVASGSGHPLSLPCRSTCSKRSPVLWLTFLLALAAFLLACFALSACSRHHSTKTAASLIEIRNELQRLSTQTHLLTERLGQIEEQALAAEAPMPSQINWLSWDLGARAMKGVSTPAIGKPPITFTAVAKPWWCPWCTTKHLPTRNTLYEQRIFSGKSPDLALLPHREQERAYCTSGRMQLAVKLPRPILPTELIIEHWLKDEVPIAGIAPRVVELWVEIGDELVRIGQWIYNIHAIQEAQKFPVAYDGPAIQRVAVRIPSNWGNPNMTCLVRAKLHGIDMSGIKETLLEQ